MPTRKELYARMFPKHINQYLRKLDQPPCEPGICQTWAESRYTPKEAAILETYNRAHSANPLPPDQILAIVFNR